MEKIEIIAKKDLKDGEYYEGHCRNSTYAVWVAKLDSFVYNRTKFGTTFIEAIDYENGGVIDCFQPFKHIEDYIKVIPKNKIVSIKEILKLQGLCPYFFFDNETMEKVTPEMIQKVESEFPIKHYGEEILWFEAWPLRKLLQQAMVMGARLEKQKHERKV